MVLLLEEVNVAVESRYYINQTMKSNQMDLGPHFCVEFWELSHLTSMYQAE